MPVERRGLFLFSQLCEKIGIGIPCRMAPNSAVF